jgi:hypothetical protein
VLKGSFFTWLLNPYVPLIGFLLYCSFLELTDFSPRCPGFDERSTTRLQGIPPNSFINAGVDVGTVRLVIPARIFGTVLIGSGELLFDWVNLVAGIARAP